MARWTLTEKEREGLGGADDPDDQARDVRLRAGLPSEELERPRVLPPPSDVDRMIERHHSLDAIRPEVRIGAGGVSALTATVASTKIVVSIDGDVADGHARVALQRAVGAAWTAHQRRLGGASEAGRE